ncbi:DUF362 domain-containing protein [bacterium]|nr:DUF362 domain-containing protein [bacterium]
MATVSLIRCDSYDPSLVAELVHEALERVGGMGRFVRRGQQVLLKPNMLAAKEPGHGITTHPAFLEAVVREVQEAGASVRIGDSPSNASKGIRYFWEKTGYLDVAERTGATLVNFEASGTYVRKAGEATFYISKTVLDADVIINIPKLKTHGLTLYTGAIKNLYGVLPGFQKTAFHSRFPHPDDFSRILAGLYGCVRPALHIMDGIVGMEGNGPSTGTLRKTGLILAGDDGIALDAVACHLMGFRPDEVDAVRFAGEMHLGESRLERITVNGESLSGARLHGFDLPSNRLMKLVPRMLVRWAGRFIWVRPQTDLARCTRCGVCIQSCPVQAIRMEDGGPVTDYGLCINCMCCNESCPEEAVIQKMSRLARLFH